jgi:phytoene/squalene synthetase
MPTLTPQQVEDAARAMPDHTLATSFLAPDARGRVVALILFAYEISRARSVVSEAGLGAIRLQWWRDTIDQIYNGQVVRAQPTAIALAGAVHEASLPRALFDAMIEGYELELQAMPFQTWQQLEHYLDQTHGNLARLSLLAAGLPAITTALDQAARQVGIAWGLAQLVATTPTWLQRRCLWLPHDAIQGLDPEQLFAGQVDGATQGAFAAVIDRIQQARDEASRSLKRAKLGNSFPVLAHACLARDKANRAMPKIGKLWATRANASLLQRQIRMTLAVALERI